MSQQRLLEQLRAWATEALQEIPVLTRLHLQVWHQYEDSQPEAGGHLVSQLASLLGALQAMAQDVLLVQGPAPADWAALTSVFCLRLLNRVHEFAVWSALANVHTAQLRAGLARTLKREQLGALSSLLPNEHVLDPDRVVAAPVRLLCTLWSCAQGARGPGDSAPTSATGGLAELLLGAQESYERALFDKVLETVARQLQLPTLGGGGSATLLGFGDLRVAWDGAGPLRGDWYARLFVYPHFLVLCHEASTRAVTDRIPWGYPLHPVGSHARRGQAAPTARAFPAGLKLVYYQRELTLLGRPEEDCLRLRCSAGGGRPATTLTLQTHPAAAGGGAPQLSSHYAWLALLRSTGMRDGASYERAAGPAGGQPGTAPPPAGGPAAPLSAPLVRQPPAAQAGTASAGLHRPPPGPPPPAAAGPSGTPSGGGRAPPRAPPKPLPTPSAEPGPPSPAPGPDLTAAPSGTLPGGRRSLPRAPPRRPLAPPVPLPSVAEPGQSVPLLLPAEARQPPAATQPPAAPPAPLVLAAEPGPPPATRAVTPPASPTDIHPGGGREGRSRPRPPSFSTPPTPSSVTRAATGYDPTRPSGSAPGPATGRERATSVPPEHVRGRSQESVSRALPTPRGRSATDPALDLPLLLFTAEDLRRGFRSLEHERSPPQPKTPRVSASLSPTAIVRRMSSMRLLVHGDSDQEEHSSDAEGFND